MGQPQTVKAYSTETGPNPSQSLACLGAFCTSPVTSLYAKAQEMPLKNRCKKLSMNYVLKLKTCPDNPAYSCVFEPPNTKLFEKSRLTPPLGLRILPLFEDSNMTWMWLMTPQCQILLLADNLSLRSVCL